MAEKITKKLQIPVVSVGGNWINRKKLLSPIRSLSTFSHGLRWNLTLEMFVLLDDKVSLSKCIAINLPTQRVVPVAIYKCAALLRALYGDSATKRPLELFVKTRDYSRFRVPIALWYDLSCWKRRKTVPSFLFFTRKLTFTEMPFIYILCSCSAQRPVGMAFVQDGCGAGPRTGTVIKVFHPASAAIFLSQAWSWKSHAVCVRAIHQGGSSRSGRR